MVPRCERRDLKIYIQKAGKIINGFATSTALSFFDPKDEVQEVKAITLSRLLRVHISWQA